MFNKLKQFNQIKSIQKELQQMKFESTKKDVTVTVNGNLMIDEIKISGETPSAELGSIIKDCVNDALKSAQKGMAEKFKQSGLGAGLQ